MLKKQSKADFLRSWGIEDPVKIKAGFSWLRYKNPPEKGVYWYYFSLYVRQRDVEDWGTCISCGCPITVETSDAGHFIPASACGRDLIFHSVNVNAECSRCNAFDDSHLFGYEKGLIHRYGEGTVEMLKSKYWEYKNAESPVKDWNADFYSGLIRALPTYEAIHNDAHT